MICRRCLQRASTGPSRRVVSSAVTSAASRQPTSPPFLNLRALSTTLPRARTPGPTAQAAIAAAAAEEAAAAKAEAQARAERTKAALSFATPLADGSASEERALSACPAGTVLSGLNYFKNMTDPVAMADEKYPEWLWACLDVKKKADSAEADDAADEFSKSKKQRRIAAKRQRTTEARLMAEGNLEALAPKIPLQQQSINMPGNEEGTVAGAVSAVAAREELRKAMRKERKFKIKESNYLKSM